nr:FapA family protein [Bacillus benzoevorans]
MEIENEVKETKWRVSIDKHKLKVHLSIEPGYKIVRSIPDMDAVHHLELKAIEKKEIVNTLNYYKVLQKLTALEIKYGLNRSEILKALETSEPGTFEIAAGMIPTKGKDGWVELKVESEMQEGPKEKEDGSIDFREYRTIPNVERGMVIGILHPPIPGQPGCTVCNEILPAKPVFPVTLRAGKGTTLIDHKIIAKDFGRPLIEKRGRLVQVKVIPKLTCKDNVNLASGNIHFSGDVEVMGEVEKNMIVEAEGNIIIKKTVTNAFLTSFSGGVISYGNIIGSEISVGKNNMLITELGHLLGNIHQNVEKMIAVIKQLTNSQAFKTNDFSRGGLQPLIRILLEKKFINFPPLVKKYVEVVNRGEKFLDDDNWKVIGVSLSQVFLSLTNEVASIDGISHISQQMKELVDFSVTPVEPDSFITIPSVLNSKLYCSGNVLVIGKGCINSKIHAGGLLKISGVLRGGEVYGRLGVDINESGAESGTLTIIAVPSDQTIRIKKVMEGTTIKIGNIKYTFKETRRNIVARLNANDRMVFE